MVGDHAFTTYGASGNAATAIPIEPAMSLHRRDIRGQVAGRDTANL